MRNLAIARARSHPAPAEADHNDWQHDVGVMLNVKSKAACGIHAVGRGAKTFDEAPRAEASRRLLRGRWLWRRSACLRTEGPWMCVHARQRTAVHCHHDDGAPRIVTAPDLRHR